MSKDLFYEMDLAYVHDVGYSRFARHAAKMLIKVFDEQLSEKGLLIDLGCGSGVVAQELVESGYKVLGIDISQALIEIAKKRAPHANFIVGSFFDIPLPECIGIVSTSECLNYATNGEDLNAIKALFRKVFASLKPGGLFIFDMVEPGTVDDRKHIMEHEDWTLFSHRREDQIRNTLTREITLFRKIGESYRKSKEIHKARLYPHKQVIALLEDVGFEVSLFKQYDELKLDEHHFGYCCKKL